MALARFARILLRHPSLAWALIRTGWNFRRRGWYRRPPFLPVPPAEYLEWRLHTAYGDSARTPGPEELRRYLRWTRWMNRSNRHDARRSSEPARPFRVGLTGNVGSGKSSVTRVWRRLGATVIDADELARRAVASGSPVLAAIREEFGDDVLRSDGALDRDAMRRLILADPDARVRLESLVHPEVTRMRAVAEKEAARRGERIVVHEIPLLFETRIQDEFDLLVLVDAPRETRIQRLVERRGLPRWEAERLDDAQMPAAEKRKRCDLVIENTGSLEELEIQAERTWREIQERARS